MTMQAAVDLTDSQYAVRRKELLALLKKLRASGAQDDLNLPRIAVIGNQSAGKSSVVEAISGITVPRDAGTCTRCPMECRMTSWDKEWTCWMSIRLEYDEKGKRLPKVSEVPFGPPLHRKEDVELSIRRAQAAVLNPHLEADVMQAQSAEELLQPPYKTSKTLKFSRNTICIDLAGPGLVDLAFVDLPGIIQNAEPDIIQLVEDMVIDHIRGQCIILVALPMTDDIENQRAMRLAKQEDPKGDRTIGVLTKPDMLGSGDTKTRNLWLDIIEGRREPLLHGYYCTKQPNDEQRAAKISTAEVRREEEEFFAKTQPWASSNQKDRFGVPRLIGTLSQLLVGFINSTLPKIRKDAAQKLQTCTQELASLPAEIEAEPATYMLTLINQFSSGVNRYIEGGGIGSNGVIHENRAAYIALKAAIRATAPNFVPVPRSKAQEGTTDELSQTKPMYVDEMKAHIDSCISRELPNNVPYSAKQVLIVEFQSSWEDHVKTCFNSVRLAIQDMLEEHVKKHFYRYDNLEGHIRVFVSEIINKHFNACLAVLKPVLAVELSPYTQNTHYLSDSTEKWRTIYKAIRSGKETLKKKSKAAIDTTESKHQALVSVAPHQTPSAQATAPAMRKQAKLEASSRSTSANVASSSPIPPSIPAPAKQPTDRPIAGPRRKIEMLRAKQAQTPSSEVSSSEDESPPVKQPGPQAVVQGKAAYANHSILEDDSKTSSEDEDDDDDANNVSKHHSNGMTKAERSAKLNQLLAGLAELGFHGLKEENLAKLVEPDEYERELAAMAEVRGYFQIAYKRIIDNVPNLIDCLFVKPIGQDIAPSLITMLSLGTQDANERCAVYLSESPTVVKRRAELTAQKHRLEEVRQALQAFGLS